MENTNNILARTPYFTTPPPPHTLYIPLSLYTMMLLLVFTLCVAAAALYLSRDLGLCGDVWCWLNRRCTDKTEAVSHEPIKAPVKTRGTSRIITTIYMVYAPGCIHCKNAMPEFNRLQQWVASPNRKGAHGYRAESLLPADIPKAIPEVQSPRDLLAQGVPLYLVVTRSADNLKPAAVSVYKGERTAKAILQFAKTKSDSFTST